MGFEQTVDNAVNGSLCGRYNLKLSREYKYDRETI